MSYTFLLEASGTPVSGFMIKAVKEAGAKVIASDIETCSAAFLADDFIVFPRMKDPRLWEITEEIIRDKNINVVIPTLDETLLTWSEKKSRFRDLGVHVIVSDPDSVRVCQDKWETFQFFSAHGIPTPKTSLKHEYELLKPRLGRGGKGIELNRELGTADMNGMIAQELLSGQEYTIDIFCDTGHNPVYIIPRKRYLVRDGKSTGGVTVQAPEIEAWVRKICAVLPFTGPVNFQCFEKPDGEIVFTEINPRVGGGSALGFAASENWVNLIIRNIIEGLPIHPVAVQYGMKMYRYYSEVFDK